MINVNEHDLSGKKSECSPSVHLDSSQNESRSEPGKPWLVVASEEEFQQYLEGIDKKLEERGGRSDSEYFRDIFDSLSVEEKEIFRKRMIKISEKYQGPGGP